MVGVLLCVIGLTGVAGRDQFLDVVIHSRPVYRVPSMSQGAIYTAVTNMQ